MKYKINFVYCLAAFLILLLFSNNTFSQDNEKKKTNPNKYEWGNIGLGFPVTGLRSDITTKSFGADYNRKVGQIFLQGSIYGGINNDIPSLFGIHFAPGYAIGYHKPVMIALSIGAGYYSGDAENRRPYKALGGNGTVQMLFKIDKDIGLGTEVFFTYPFLGTQDKMPASNGIRVVLTISTK